MNKKAHARINENSRLVIPASFRKALGIEQGDKVVLQIDDDELRITTMRQRLERARRRIRSYVKPGRSLADELIAKRREQVIR